MDFGLSVLDVSPVSSGSDGAQALRNTLELARLADRLGYERYWLAEHHNLPTIASSAPEIMIGHVANVTERIRVGAGGIMLPNHAPLKVAETFRVLEALHPERVDLGIGRAPAPTPSRPQPCAAHRTGLARRTFRSGLASFLPSRARVPGGSSVPVCGRHAERRRAAADLAAGLQRLLGDSGREDGPRLCLRLALQPYGPGPRHARIPRELRTLGGLRTPSAILAVAVTCGETEEDASTSHPPWSWPGSACAAESPVRYRARRRQWAILTRRPNAG